MNTLTPSSRGEKKKIPEVERFLLLMHTLDMHATVLSEKIDISSRTINNVIYENKPLGWQLVRKLNSILGVSIDWLLGGHGAMFVSIGFNESQPDYQMIDPRVFRMTSFINQFFETASDDDKAWLEMQFKYNVPPYAEFLKKDIKDE